MPREVAEGAQRLQLSVAVLHMQLDTSQGPPIMCLTQ